MKKVIHWLAFLVISFHTQADVPGGIYVLIPPDKAIPERLLQSSQITGMVIRANWQEIYVSEQEIDVTEIKLKLQQITKAGKAASLVVNNGGLNTPEQIQKEIKNWLQFSNKNRFHDTHKQDVGIPLFWDETLLKHKTNLLRLLARELAGFKALKLISVQCANATTDDWNVPPNLQWNQSRFDDDKLFFACKSLIDSAATLFPTAAVRMAVGPIQPPLMRDRYALARRIYHYASQTYPGRFYIQRHNLSTTTPNPNETRRLMGWQLIFDARPYAAAQFLWPVSDTKSCRTNGQISPCDSLTMLDDIYNLISGYRLHYLEVYASDALRFADKPQYQQFTKMFDGTGTITATQVPAVSVNSAAISPDSTQQGNPMPEHTDQKDHQQAGQLPSPLDSLAPGDSWGRWKNQVGERPLPRLVSHLTFKSELLKTEVGYTLYLPKNTSNQALPVIYWLHGKGGNEIRGAYIPQYLEKAIQKGIIRPTAMVLINGGLHSFYSNSFDGKHPVEDMLIQELIPLAESRHSIGGNPDMRMLEGFSMGGFGALKLAAKYPDYFNSVQTYGAALLSEQFMPFKQDAAAYQNVFSSDPNYFILNSPSYWLKHNADKIRKRHLAIRMLVGSKDGTRRYNDAAHEALQKLGLEHEYGKLEGVAHTPRMYYEADPYGSFGFHEQALRMRESDHSF
ncbi:hypothetical protein DXV75_05645 [Alteromonas aestuariivivens]|uniref:Esterase n=1 Tax=Alteromonas aestuariivivens TaxID=1938339 RepID=A0A3D8MB40_9ALTE|nr:alpha/beta hydrolase-fold protein [Alteromonas aestuariivivens]RDV27510.1 hypothetical protein DXV75_05645 [Alteromonas aestuariivivens]